MAVTVALATTAPEGSFTTPVMTPVFAVWANAEAGTKDSKSPIAITIAPVALPNFRVPIWNLLWVMVGSNDRNTVDALA
jgi:hypothetical protein